VKCTPAEVPEENVSNSEQRKLTGKVLVRFTEEDLEALQQQASRQGVSLPALMRELSLRTLEPQAS
jgi:predicted DNA binding CopG/RHH family protein